MAKFNDEDRKFAENEVGSIRRGYTDYGMSISNALVEARAKSVKTANNVTSVRVLISTTIQYTEPAVSGVQGIQESKWDDNHEISFSRFETRDNKIGIQNDTTLSDSDTASGAPNTTAAPKAPLFLLRWKVKKIIPNGNVRLVLDHHMMRRRLFSML